MNTVYKNDLCAGCKLCAEICPMKAIAIREGIKAYNAVIYDEKCIHCGLCHRMCPQNHSPEFVHPIMCCQGWSRDIAMRANGASGGLASAISTSFIAQGGEVLTCRFRNGKFGFEFFDSTKDLSKAAGSKYVKSDPEGIYKPLLQKLREGKKVLMIALPCQIAAAKNHAKDFKNFYTIDLICHGTPALETLRLYLKSKGINLDGIRDIRFRKKDSFGINSDFELLEKYGVDLYTHAFLNSLSYTENCYHCQYARIERVTDLTLGDSWGSEMEREERDKGISLILVQTERGSELLRMADLELKDVNMQRAIEANMQLKRPSLRAKGREKFLDEVEKGKSFEAAIFRIDKIRFAKNIIKKYILKKAAGGYSIQTRK